MTTHLPQFQQRIQYHNLAAFDALVVYRQADFFVHRYTNGLIKITLRTIQLDLTDNLALRWQFCRHIRLFAPKQERRYTVVQLCLTTLVLLLFDRSSK